MGRAIGTWAAALRWPMLVGALAAAATVGATARGSTALTLRRPPQLLGTALTVPLAAVVLAGVLLFLVALISLVHRPRKDPDLTVHESDTPLHAQVVALATALVLASLLVAVPLGLYLLVHPSGGRTIPAPGGTPTSTTSPAPARGVAAHPTHAGFSPIWWIVAAILLVLIVVLAIAFHRRAGAVESTRDKPPVDLVGRAAAAAEQAMATTASDDVRAAVIACYEAMEGVLASRGHPRAPAQTPEELLRAAHLAVTHAASRDAAVRLVVLFGEARYSRHPMTESDRQSAGQALTALQDRAQQP